MIQGHSTLSDNACPCKTLNSKGSSPTPRENNLKQEFFFVVENVFRMERQTPGASKDQNKVTANNISSAMFPSGATIYRQSMRIWYIF
jgi:hypothetical protein